METKRKNKLVVGLISIILSSACFIIPKTITEAHASSDLSMFRFTQITGGYSIAVNSTYYEIIFNSNNGVGTMANQIFTVGEAQNLTSNTFTRTSRDFVGWNKYINPTRVGIFDGDEVLDIAEPGDTIELYAIWSTSGLSYTLLSDGTYSVSRGTATENYVFIPTYHNGKEVSEIVAHFPIVQTYYTLHCQER